MKKVMMVITQILIFTGAYFVMTPDQVVDNTYVFGLIGSYDIIPGNTQWVMLGAMILSVINIWLWWPKSPTHKTVGDNVNTRSAEAKEAKAIDQDPKTPTLD